MKYYLVYKTFFSDEVLITGGHPRYDFSLPLYPEDIFLACQNTINSALIQELFPTIGIVK
jgi:hypothetical protein